MTTPLVSSPDQGGLPFPLFYTITTTRPHARKDFEYPHSLLIYNVEVRSSSARIFGAEYR